MNPRFDARLDDMSKIISYLVPAVLIVPLILMGNIALRGNPEVLIPFGVVVLVLGITFLYRVQYYEITTDSLQIGRKAGIRSYPLAGFASATPVTTKELGFGIRLFGSGGFLGYLGTFYYRNAGKVQAFATDRKKLILLRTKDGRQILVSPEEPDRFLQTLKLPTAPMGELA